MTDDISAHQNSRYKRKSIPQNRKSLAFILTCLQGEKLCQTEVVT